MGTMENTKHLGIILTKEARDIHTVNPSIMKRSQRSSYTKRNIVLKDLKPIL